jgi:hypothetical protein
MVASGELSPGGDFRGRLTNGQLTGYPMGWTRHLGWRLRYSWMAEENDTATFHVEWFIFLWGGMRGEYAHADPLPLTEQDKAWYRVQPELGM